MQKYWTIFKISFAEEFAYKLNFILWRVRNVFHFLLNYFLWSTVFADATTVIFGYDRSKILTYIFGLLIVRAVVGSARAMDISNDIAQGDLSNYLVKPLTYFKYWFTRDISSKALNLFFAVIEFSILFLIFRPQFFVQQEAVILVLFAVVLVMAVLIYFAVLVLVSSITFWAPEMSWAGHFLITFVIVEALSGSLFPINILPNTLQTIVMATPFPYLLYFPVQVYLGNITGNALIIGMLTMAFWTGALYFLMGRVWKKGLEAYEATGR
jgi:ABC-2 type transport system permease protein